MNTDNLDDYTEISAEVPLNDMFGFSTDLRSVTQGKGEFSMEYQRHAEVTAFVQNVLIEEYKKKREAQRAKK
jgi:elongation factor G